MGQFPSLRTRTDLLQSSSMCDNNTSPYSEKTKPVAERLPGFLLAAEERQIFN